MKSPNQLKNEAKKIILPATAGLAGLLMLAGCSEHDSSDSNTPANQGAPAPAPITAPNTAGLYMKVGDRPDVVPVDPVSGEPIAVPHEYIKGMRKLPAAKPGEQCASVDVSPSKLRVFSYENGHPVLEGFKKDPQTITPQDGVFNDTYMVDYRHLAGDEKEGYIEIIQQPEDKQDLPWMRLVLLSQVEDRGVPGYVELPDSKPDTTMGILVDLPHDNEHWAQVTAQICTPKEASNLQ